MITSLFKCIIRISITASAVYIILKPLMHLFQNHIRQSWGYHISEAIALLFLIPCYKIWNFLPASPHITAVNDASTISKIPSGISSVDVYPTHDIQIFENHATSVEFIFDWLALFWLLISCIIIMWNIHCLKRFHRKIKSAQSVRNKQLLQITQEQAQKLGIRRKIDLLTDPSFESAALVGYLRPVILLPSGQLTPHDAQLILKHELIHFRRGDTWKKLLMEFVCAIHWFNPLVYFLRKDFNNWTENSCDERIAANLDFAQRKEYANLILNYSCPHPSTTQKYFPTFASPRKKIERRLKFMLSAKNKYNPLICTILVVVAVISCVAVSAIAAEPNTTSEIAYEEPMAAVKIEGPGPGFEVESRTTEEVSESYVIEGEVGDRFACGSLIIEIVSQDEIDTITSETQTRASKKLWSTSLSGDSISKSFSVTSSYPYAKVWIQNAGSGDIKFTITKSSPTGTVISGSNITVSAGTSVSIYSTGKWTPAIYYANCTSGKVNMSGTMACRVASTIEELDI